MSCLHITKRFSILPLTVKLEGYKLSIDGTNWVDDQISAGTYDFGVYVKGDHYPKGVTFEVSNNFYVSGSLSSLVDNGLGEAIETITEEGAFRGLFSNSLISSFMEDELLPFSHLSPYCFEGLFENCKELSSLGARSQLFGSVSNGAEGCCKAMFQGCNLTGISDHFLANFPLADRCFDSMFKNNTSLQVIPGDLFPGIDVAVPDYCYRGMFEGCSGLTVLPDNLLPAAMIGFFSYQEMFKNCSGLTAIPKDFLPAEIYENCAYMNMFEGCSSLTAVNKDLFKFSGGSEDYHFVLNNYSGMFKNCSKLSYIEVPFTRWPTTAEHAALSDWVLGVAEHGTFICPKELPLVYGTSNIPEGWKVNPAGPFSVNFLAKHKIGGRTK